MNRAIKFRAWHKEIQKMMDWDELIAYANDSFWHVNTVNFFADPELVIMQDTGLKDKNGKEIHEGDILNTNKAITLVKFVQNVACFTGFQYVKQKYNQAQTEVIGNIFENPDLLPDYGR